MLVEKLGDAHPCGLPIRYFDELGVPRLAA